MQVSVRDPFMNKPKPVWRAIHKPPTTTKEIMESIEPYETRRQTDIKLMARFKDQEKRYYKPDTKEVKKRMEMIKENKRRQKETLANSEEVEKLNRVKAELESSIGLTEVASDFHLFEMAANEHFNKHMN